MTLVKHVFAFSALVLSLTFSVHAKAEAGILTTVVTLPQRNILGNAQGRSLYTFDVDQPNVSNCSGGCAAVWPPVLTTETDLTAPFGSITRQDGTTQLSINGKALYLFARDANTGDILGDGLNGTWHLVPLDSLRAN